MNFENKRKKLSLNWLNLCIWLYDKLLDNLDLVYKYDYFL